MSKLACRCGHVIVDQTDDLPYKGEVIADIDWESIWGELGADGRSRDQTTPDIIASLLVRFARTVYECTSCGRLWIQKTTEANEFVSFLPEFGNQDRILQPRAAEQAVAADRPKSGSG